MVLSDLVDEEGVCQALGLLECVMSGKDPRRISWEAETWFSAIATLLDKVSWLRVSLVLYKAHLHSYVQTESFFVVDQVVRAALLLGNPDVVQPQLCLDQPAKTSVLLSSVRLASLSAGLTFALCSFRFRNFA
jgi:hypothetical protein